MKAMIHGSGDYWYWTLGIGGNAVVQSQLVYTRRRSAKRGLLRFLKGMKKGVEVVE